LPIAIMLSVLAAASWAGQAPAGDATFEAVSIRRNLSGRDGGGGRPRGGGGYTFTNVTVRSLISLAYNNMPFDRILGGPTWLLTDQYDVDTVGKENATMADRGVMVRSLLRDRFQLAVHMDRRDLPVYFLVLARADGRL